MTAVVHGPTAAVEGCSRVSGPDPWTVARQFRVAFGTGPGRFRTTCPVAGLAVRRSAVDR